MPSSLLYKGPLCAGHKPTILHSDGACEYFTEPVNKYCLEQQIKKETCNACEQSGNCRVETRVNTIGKGVRVSLLTSGLPWELWGFTAINFVDVYNHLPHASSGSSTHHCLFHADANSRSTHLRLQQHHSTQTDVS
jgi:hypothetical protein